jgi:transcriptional regulator NrdR family protein
MAHDVNLVGSRVSVMHLAYDCPGCASTVAVSITDGKESDGRRRLLQRPRDCPNCGERISIAVVVEASEREHVAR